MKGPSSRVLFLAAFFLTGGTLFAAGCRPSSPQEQEKGARQVLFVSILPQAYFAQRLAGAAAKVHVLVGPGQSPATYEPTPRQLSALGRTRLFFQARVPFEENLAPRLARLGSGLEMVDTRAGITLRQQPPHAHGHGGQGPTAGDPHFWLDPRRAAAMADNMARALLRVAPDQAQQITSNLGSLLRDLKELERELSSMLAPVRGRDVFVYHGAFGYFCERFGLRQVALSSGGKEPGARELARFIERVRGVDRARVLFVQPQFSRQSAEAVSRELGVEVRSLDPLTRDYFKSLRAMASSILAALTR